MTISFKRLGKDWVVSGDDNEVLNPGDTVTVTLKSGDTKQVKIAEPVVVFKFERIK